MQILSGLASNNPYSTFRISLSVPPFGRPSNLKFDTEALAPPPLPSIDSPVAPAPPLPEYPSSPPAPISSQIPTQPVLVSHDIDYELSPPVPSLRKRVEERRKQKDRVNSLSRAEPTRSPPSSLPANFSVDLTSSPSTLEQNIRDVRESFLRRLEKSPRIPPPMKEKDGGKNVMVIDLADSDDDIPGLSNSPSPVAAVSTFNVYSPSQPQGGQSLTDFAPDAHSASAPRGSQQTLSSGILAPPAERLRGVHSTFIEFNQRDKSRAVRLTRPVVIRRVIVHVDNREMEKRENRRNTIAQYLGTLKGIDLWTISLH